MIERPAARAPLSVCRTARPASAFARTPKDVVLNLDRTADAKLWATMNGVPLAPMLTPLGNARQSSTSGIGGLSSSQVRASTLGLVRVCVYL